MATIKFKDPSPYKQPKPPVPAEDYLYSKYEADLAADSKPADQKINIALFGVGRAGTIHLASLVKNARVNILYIVDDVVERHKKIQKYWELNDTKFLISEQADMVYRDPKVTAVIVASPTFTHETIVTASLLAKKAVFCEKPVAETREATLRCFKLAKDVNKPLLCAFNRRFDPSYGAVREKVHNGEVGHVQTIKVCSRDSPLPSIDYLKISGGIFHDCAVHDIDIICWVLGEYPCKVGTVAVSNVEEIAAIDDFDTVAITLLFPSGTIGMIDLSRNSCFGYDQRLEVFGARGMIRADNEQPIHCVDVQNGNSGITTAPIWYSFPSRYRNAYQAEMEHFLDLVENKTKPKVLGSETLAICKIATAAEESARTGKFVELKWDSNEL